MSGGEEELQQLRSRATELLFKQDWKEYINLYTHFINNSAAGAGAPQHSKSLPSALSNRADARYRLKDLPGALRDCNSALDLDQSHLRSLVSKGRILLDLDCYSGASECFQLALALERSDPSLRELLDRCKRLELQSGTGAVDLSDWLASGFAGKPPELAEYVGPVEIRRPEGSGRRGMFLTKNVEAGTVLAIAKPVVIGRAILPESGADSARMVMWKDFVDRILEATERCGRTLSLLYMLSTGEEDETGLVVPDMGLFRPGIVEEDRFSSNGRAPDVRRIVEVLDVNCLNEEAASAKVLGRTASGYCGVGLWVLPSFVNHSCCPNARRSHVGDTVVVHASRDMRAGEEVTFAYFDVLLPLGRRRELAKKWGFECGCERCGFEEGEEVPECGSDLGEFVIGVEESMKRRMMGKKERGFLRASHWGAYAGVYESEKMMRRWGRRIPAELVVAESVADAVGGDERVLKAVLGSLKKKGGGGGSGIGGCGGVVEMERMMRMGRGVYGKVAKKHGMRALFELLAQ